MARKRQVEKTVDTNIVKRGDKYKVSLVIKKKTVYIGSFDTLDEARIARDKARAERSKLKDGRTIRAEKRIDKLKKELIGKRVGKLTILDVFAETREGRRAYYLKCKCDCGNFTSPLMSTVIGDTANVVSCGCYREDKGKDTLNTYLYKGTRVTNLNYKPRSITGVKGVSRKPSGNYSAIINFKGKQIYLGTYSTLEDAKKARLAAEKKYFEPILKEFNEQAKYKVKIEEEEDGKQNK